MEYLNNPVLTGIIGLIAPVILFFLFPNLLRARIQKEIAEAEKVNAESDSIQMKSIGDTFLKTAEAFHQIAVTMSENAKEYANTLKEVSNANVTMFQWVQEKDKEHSSERKIMLDRINELSAQVKRLQDEKDVLEETLEAANIRIEKLEGDNEKYKRELRQLEKDHLALKKAHEELIAERDKLLAKMMNISLPTPPAELVADTLNTHILNGE